MQDPSKPIWFDKPNKEVKTHELKPKKLKNDI